MWLPASRQPLTICAGQQAAAQITQAGTDQCFIVSEEISVLANDLWQAAALKAAAQRVVCWHTTSMPAISASAHNTSSMHC